MPSTTTVPQGNKVVVVFGATGLQGSWLIHSLTQRNLTKQEWTIIALTRNPSSSISTLLAGLPGVKTVKVDDKVMEQPMAVLSSLGYGNGEIYGVFSVQGYVDDKAMVRQGNAIADAAKDFGVKHFVYSSSDFGGLDDCGIATFEVKRQVENHIRSISLPFTFLRPAQFMDNLVPTSPFLLKMGRTVLVRYTFLNHPERKHQMISGRDIGRAGAEAFVRGPGWMGGEVRLAGDEITIKQLQATYQETMHEPVSLAPWPLAWLVSSLVPIMKQSTKFWDNHGYNIPISTLRAELPELEDLPAFLRRYKANGTSFPV